MSAADPAWVRIYENGLQFTEHLDGVDWMDAPLPPRWHRCRAQTRGMTSGGMFMQRCACGAVYLMGGWIEKNSTRKMRARQRKAAHPSRRRGGTSGRRLRGTVRA